MIEPTDEERAVKIAHEIKQSLIIPMRDSGRLSQLDIADLVPVIAEILRQNAEDVVIPRVELDNMLAKWSKYTIDTGWHSQFRSALDMASTMLRKLISEDSNYP